MSAVHRARGEDNQRRTDLRAAEEHVGAAEKTGGL